MGFFGKLFEKKNCDICGGEIGLLGNRKLEDGNLCKECAKKLSPWFSERRQSTVEEIRSQLEYREANRAEVEKFNVTRTLGMDTRVLLDEDAGKFMVTSARRWQEANPDVLDFSQVTGCDVDVEESKSEEKRELPDGKEVSYNPPRYHYSYEFWINIHVNSPWFDRMHFRLGDDVEVNASATRLGTTVNPRQNVEYQERERMANEIRTALTQVRRQVRKQAEEAAAPKQAVTCPWCGATTTPDESGRCEYCGGSVRG